MIVGQAEANLSTKLTDFLVLMVIGTVRIYLPCE